MNVPLLLTAFVLTLSGGATMAQPTQYPADPDPRRTSLPSSPADLNTRSDSYGQPGFDHNPYSTPTHDTHNDSDRYGPGRGNGYGNRRRGGYNADRRQDIGKVQYLDRIVNLTGRQKRDLFAIENYYDRELAQASRYPGTLQRIQWQKSQDVLSVLSPGQRDRLFVYEQHRNGYGSGYGHSSRGWTPPAGRRW